MRSQGIAFPYTHGLWLISQLVSAINPSDLRLLREGRCPLSKYSLDHLLGRIHTPKVRDPPYTSPDTHHTHHLTHTQEYQYYFTNFPRCSEYVEMYERLLSTESPFETTIPATKQRGSHDDLEDD